MPLRRREGRTGGSASQVRLGLAALVMLANLSGFIPGLRATAEADTDQLARARTGEAADETTPEARKLFARANRYLERSTRAEGPRRERLLQKALEAYTECMQVVRSPNVIFNLALTLEELGRHAEAFGYYTEYLGMEERSEAETQEARERRDRLLPHLAVVRLASEPPGATVRIDAEEQPQRGATPLVLAVSEGPHTAVFSHPAYGEMSLPFVARLGEQVRVQADLESLVAVPPEEPAAETETSEELEDAVPENGVLEVRSQVPSVVLVDGHAVGRGERLRETVSPGTHRVHVQAVGYEPVDTSVEVQPGQTHKLTATLAPSREDERRMGSWPLYAWIATGAVGAAAAGLGIWALSEKQDYDDEGRSDQSQHDKVKTANLIADVAWGTTAALAISALVLTLMDGPAEQEPSRIAIGVSPVADGLSVQARGIFGEL